MNEPGAFALAFAVCLIAIGVFAAAVLLASGWTLASGLGLLMVWLLFEFGSWMWLAAEGQADDRSGGGIGRKDPPSQA